MKNRTHKASILDSHSSFLIPWVAQGEPHVNAAHCIPRTKNRALMETLWTVLLNVLPILQHRLRTHRWVASMPASADLERTLWGYQSVCLCPQSHFEQLSRESLHLRIQPVLGSASSVDLHLRTLVQANTPQQSLLSSEAQQPWFGCTTASL